MTYDLHNSSLSVYSSYYHFTQIVNFVRKVFTKDTTSDFLKMKTGQIAYAFQVDMPDVECNEGFFHMLYKATSIPKIQKLIDEANPVTSGMRQHNLFEMKKRFNLSGIIYHCYSCSHGIARNICKELDIKKLSVQTLKKTLKEKETKNACKGTPGVTSAHFGSMPETTNLC